MLRSAYCRRQLPYNIDPCNYLLLEAGSDPFITDPNTHQVYKLYMDKMLNEESPVHLHIQSALLL